MKQSIKKIGLWPHILYVSIIATIHISLQAEKTKRVAIADTHKKAIQTSKKNVSKDHSGAPNLKLSTASSSLKKQKKVTLTPRKKLYKTMVPQKEPKAAPIIEAKPTLALSQEETEYKEQLLKKTIQYMKEDELREAKKYAELIQSDKHLISQYIERLLILSNDQAEKQTLRFELANYYFDKQDMKKAGRLFREYIRLYPGCKRRDQAEYKEILSRFHARVLPPRDQRKTMKVLRLTNNYIDSANTQKRSYLKEIKEIQHTCQEDLFSYEYDIAYQYMIRKQFKAAETRLAYIRSELLSHLKEKEPMVLELEIAIAQQQTSKDHTDEITQKIATLQSHWPDYKPTLFAHAKTYKKPSAYKHA